MSDPAPAWSAAALEQLAKVQAMFEEHLRVCNESVDAFRRAVAASSGGSRLSSAVGVMAFDALASEVSIRQMVGVVGQFATAAGPAAAADYARARAAAIDPAIAVASSRGRGSVMVAAVSLAECDGLSAVRSLFVEAAYMFSSVQSQIKGG